MGCINSPNRVPLLDDEDDRIARQRSVRPSISRNAPLSHKQYAIIAIRPLRYAFRSWLRVI